MSDTREAALTTINTLMEANGIKPDEILSCKTALDSLRGEVKTTCKFIHRFYEELVELSNEHTAWDFVTNEMPRDWIDFCDIVSPRKYKVVTVNIEFALAVPANWEDAEIEDYALQQDFERKAELLLTTDENNIPEKEVEWHDFVNNIDEFIDRDFDE